MGNSTSYKVFEIELLSPQRLVGNSALNGRLAKHIDYHMYVGTAISQT